MTERKIYLYDDAPFFNCPLEGMDYFWAKRFARMSGFYTMLNIKELQKRCMPITYKYPISIIDTPLLDMVHKEEDERFFNVLANNLYRVWWFN